MFEAILHVNIGILSFCESQGQVPFLFFISGPPLCIVNDELAEGYCMRQDQAVTRMNVYQKWYTFWFWIDRKDSVELLDSDVYTFRGLPPPFVTEHGSLGEGEIMDCSDTMK